MIALIVRRQEIDTLNWLFLQSLVIQAPIPAGLSGSNRTSPIRYMAASGSGLRATPLLTGQNLCKKIPNPSPAG